MSNAQFKPLTFGFLRIQHAHGKSTKYITTHLTILNH